MNEDWEIISLNARDLDIQELERRLELATANDGLDGWVCGVDGVCGADCGSNCVGNCGENCIGNCPSLCGANVCYTHGCPECSEP